MLGQNLHPSSYDRRVDRLSDMDVLTMLETVKRETRIKVEQAPPHEEFLANYLRNGSPPSYAGEGYT